MPDWFLPAGSPGSRDEWCFQTIATSEVKVYADYSDYFGRLADLFAQAKKGDEIFLVGWGFGLDQVLKNGKSALFFLEAARGRGARVRLLATISHTWSDNATEMAAAVAKKLDAVVDDQLLPSSSPSDVITSHQKAAVVKLESGTHLFVGGMDVTENRVGKWFDVQAEVVGPGATLGRKTLDERWESVKPTPGAAAFAPRTVIPSAKGGDFEVQFVRTYPPFPAQRTAWKRTYAEKGDHTYYELLCRAIAKARKTIYIEDHLFLSMGAAPSQSNPSGGSSPKERSDVTGTPATVEALLANAAGRGVKLVIVADHHKHSRVDRSHVVRTLSSGTTRLDLLQTREDMPWVHSKTWIVDDDLVVIGSANVWARSFISSQIPAEAEFGVAIRTELDGTSLGFPGAPWARALRIKLWERIRRSRQTAYSFPRDAGASWDDEVRELKSPVGGVDPLLPM